MPAGERTKPLSVKPCYRCSSTDVKVWTSTRLDEDTFYTSGHVKCNLCGTAIEAGTDDPIAAAANRWAALWNSRPLKDLLGRFFALEREIHARFGYVEDWVRIPLEDCTEVWWWLQDNKVWYTTKQVATVSEAVESEDAFYDALIYRQRFLPRWVYGTATHTLVCMDTQTDGNHYLGVFANDHYIGNEPWQTAVAKQRKQES
jgi:hypothetical protein